MQKKRKRTQEEVSPLTLPPLTYLVASNSNLLSIRARQAKKIRIKKIVGAKMAKRIATPTFLQ